VTCLLCCSCAKIAAVVAVAVAVGVAVVAAFAVVNVNLIKTNRLRNAAQMGATTVGRLAPGFFSPFFFGIREQISLLVPLTSNLQRHSSANSIAYLQCAKIVCPDNCSLKTRHEVILILLAVRRRCYFLLAFLLSGLWHN